MLTLVLFRCANPGVLACASASHAVDQLWNSFEFTGARSPNGIHSNMSGC
jgi:hypothetical protein